MSRRESKRKELSSGGAPAWMTTYSDLMSLLLTFFILLYSMSNVDVEKFKNITNSLQAILMGLDAPTIIEGGSDSEPIPIDQSLDMNNYIDAFITGEIREMYDKVSQYISEEDLDAQVAVSMNQQGVFVDIKVAILFEPGSAELKGSGYQVLNQLEGLINDFDNDIVIEGHTDNVPTNSEIHPTNWELSTARAVSVVRFLSEVEKVDPRRLAAIGYGEYRPIAPNDTTYNKAANRRVNILIVFDKGSEYINGDSGTIKQ